MPFPTQDLDGQAHLVRINSRERRNAANTSANNFRVEFSSSNQLMDINRIVIKHVSIPNVQYNVKPANQNTPVGNVFSYFDGALQSITVTPGYYSISQLIAAIVSDPIAIADGLSITLDPVTKKLVFASVNPITYLSLSSGNSMGTILGISSNSAPAVLGFNAPSFPNLAIHPNIYIASSSLSDGSNLVSPSLGSLPVCAVIPIDQPFGGIVQYTSQQEHLDDIMYTSFANGKSIQSVDLQVYDGDANLIDLQGLEWTMVIKAYQVPP